MFLVQKWDFCVSTRLTVSWGKKKKKKYVCILVCDISRMVNTFNKLLYYGLRDVIAKLPTDSNILKRLISIV